ncbi:hypothetical protein COCSUDRAFT_46027 [Coccomyxa subellipsoidea C-169]|uniref:Uncharacterized protein n=1 Tax=Coccomyxa subellipsoidea (strain C-169) TaxID=574566 RepID=I0Z6M4_COCSC|nr:hypothetical protein COCSUDRAFT_46027 [Coccomyxa subellipsoidea C-169]EIE26293.1 hypothetical protein COCSUDRAFT_46027 [Coccomyxa subellipsoidea C-169]|eukprot:XP_005650837.1 hypothetical protein COCSUDRAFT_46027 [Coccomyxa subellipsoidea C-169]
MVVSDQAKSRAKKQIEFYFSDSNLPRDKFLREKIAEDPEGWVNLELLCTFTRMTEALGISRKGKDGKVEVSRLILSQVAEALQGSDSITVSEDGRSVRRTKPIESPEEVSKEVDARSLFASPFPYDTTLDAVTAFFNTVAPVNCVRMRRHLNSSDFRGSVFVEFACEEQATEVMSKSLVYEGAPLRLERKVDFVNRKQEERSARGATGEAHSLAAGEEAFFTQFTGGYPDAVPASGSEEEEGTPEPAEPEKLDYEEGCLMRFDFVDANHELAYTDIRDTFQDIAYGAPSGIVRFKNKNAVGPNLMLVGDDDTVSVSGKKATLKVLEGEEEKDFYMRAKAARQAAAERGDGGGRGQKRGRGGSGRGRGRAGGGRRGGRGKRGRH